MSELENKSPKDNLIVSAEFRVVDEKMYRATARLTTCHTQGGNAASSFDALFARAKEDFHWLQLRHCTLVELSHEGYKRLVALQFDPRDANPPPHYAVVEDFFVRQPIGVLANA